MRKNTLLICLLLYAGIAYAQTDTLECDKPDRDTTEAKALPWFDDNDYLEDFWIASAIRLLLFRPGLLAPTGCAIIFP
jgi:hypothetical protein